MTVSCLHMGTTHDIFINLNPNVPDLCIRDIKKTTIKKKKNPKRKALCNFFHVKLLLLVLAKILCYMYV